MTGRITDSTAEPAVVVLRAYDLGLWIVRKVEKFPRSYRFSIGDRLTARSLDLIDDLVEASYSSDKRLPLDRAVRRVNSLRFLLRFAGDLGLLGTDSKEFAATKLEEIGRMTGGWRRSVTK